MSDNDTIIPDDLPSTTGDKLPEADIEVKSEEPVKQDAPPVMLPSGMLML